jgi:uncharacterized protein (DUF58 family)
MANGDFNANLEGLEWADRFIDRIDLRILFPVLIIVLFLIAWNRGVALLYGSFWLLMSMFALAWLYPRLGLRNITVRRSMPAHAHEGDAIDIRYEITSRAVLSRYLVELWDRIPFVSEEAMLLLPRLKKSAQLRHRLVCELRGVYSLGTIRLRSGFPLGIGTAEQEVESTPQSIVVYPNPEPVTTFYNGADLSSKISNDFYIERAGGHEEFMSVREYRPGDSPRYIHWPTSARQRELIVREFHESTSPSLTIVLDLHRGFNIGSRRDSTLEYSVKIAASLGTEALKRGWRVNLFGMGNEPVRLMGLTGEKEVMGLLEALAYVQCDGSTSYAQTLQNTVQSGVHGGTIVVFDLDDAPAQTAALARRDFFMLRYSFETNSFRSEIAMANRFRASSTRHGMDYGIRKGVTWAQLFA